VKRVFHPRQDVDPLTLGEFFGFLEIQASGKNAAIGRGQYNDSYSVVALQFAPSAGKTIRRGDR